ncbi:hypothetical protein KR074_002002 [Drosophila pseudoananassae]|nr:hypothetical protein KR074_002002 [Drosophila pseudoananassae]
MGDLASSSSVAELAKHEDVEEEIEIVKVETEASKVAAHQEYAEALSLSGRRSESVWNRRRFRPRKVLTVAAILVALMLVVGAIYLHLQQKHHLGRLNFHSKDNVPQSEELELDGITLITEAGVAGQTPTPTTTTGTVSETGPNRQMSSECFACLAATATNNVPAFCNDRVPCGIYRISHLYWQDAQQWLRPQNDSLIQDYKGCVVQNSCAERIVEGYVQRYAFDCNGDGRIECRDHIMLHLLGPGGCRKHVEWSGRSPDQCLRDKGLS